MTTNEAIKLIQTEKEGKDPLCLELSSPMTQPVSLSKSLEDTESTGSMNESISAFSFANSNDSQNFETSYSFEMALVDGDEPLEETNPGVTPNRKSRRSLQGQKTPPHRPSRHVPHNDVPNHCTNDVPSQGRQSSDAFTTPPRRLPQRNSTMSGSRLNRSLSNVSGCRTPLAREKSKLFLLSQHGSQHSSKTINSTGTISRNSGTRLRPMERSVSGLTSKSDEILDGNASSAQLQIGDCVMLANKELSTSAHLIRRMPRQRRTGSRRSMKTPPPHNPSSFEEGGSTTDTLMDMIAACSRE